MLALFLHGWRSWKSAKAVALLAVAALAAGIGSATAIYTVVNAVLLKPIPWQGGERFVTIFSSRLSETGKFRWMSTSWPNLLYFQQRTHSFEAFGIYLPRDFSLTAPGEPQQIGGALLSPSLAASLGVAPVLGRWFGEPAAEQGRTDLALIAFGLWQRLGGDAAIVGRTLTMDGRQYTVIGVLPAWFQLPISRMSGGDARTEVWLPLNPQGDQQTLDYAVYFAYARLKPGVTVAQADAEVKRVAAEIAREHPKGHREYTAVVVGLLDSVVKEIRPALLQLFGGAGALLLIACANVAGLLLARSVSRVRETAVRLALGAARWQLALQYFMEGLLIALTGAAAGIAVSAILLRLVLSIAFEHIPRADTVRTDWTAVAFAIAIAILSSLLFSLAPLWQASRTLPNEALSDGARASAPWRSRRLSRSLVVTEIALAFALLSVSAVLIAHWNRLLHTSPGFDAEGILTFTINTSDAEYPDPARLTAYHKRLMEAVRSVPGVRSVALVNSIPLSGCCFTVGILPEGQPGTTDIPRAAMRLVSPGYFQTMRIPLLRGVDFDGRPPAQGEPLPIVIDDATAKRYWPGRDALGSHARLGRADGGLARVIGIVGNVRNRGLADLAEPEVYLPPSVVKMNPTRFVVRSPLPASTVMADVRRAIRGVNPAQPLTETRSLGEVVLGSMTNERLQSFLTAFFALAALLMAALGVYGVVSYSVRLRTVEIGTRMALGAVGRDVLRLVVGDGLKMAVYGILAGGVAVMAAAFLLRSRIFEIRIDDPSPFLFSTAIVAGFTALASFFPSWRATLVSPMAAIRDDAVSIWASARTALTKRVSDRMSSRADERTVSESTLLAGFVEASRHAESYRQAIERALAALRETLQSESALLLEKGSGNDYRCAASTPGDCANGAALPCEGLLAGGLRGFPYPLPISPEDLDAWARWAAAERPGHVPEIESIRGWNSAIAVPLLVKNEISGILLLGPPVARSSYSPAEKLALRSCAGQFALMIENARLTERVVEQEKVDRDLQLAAEVQKRLFPDKPPAMAAVTLAGISIPARSVGGDYYDFLDLGGKRIGIALADVAGKGVAAALIMSVVQASLRILAAEGATLGTLAAKMNRYLHRSTGSNAYATFFYAEIDEKARKLRYVNAGHNPPCLLRYGTDRSIEELPAGGTVIGLFPQSSYEECAVELRAGGVLMAFTDGVPEALNPLEEEFGEERLKELLRESAHLPVSEMASRIASELKNWIYSAAQYDDLTFILMKVNQEV